MDNNPKISIVLPCYNGAKMIGEAIQSIIAQTYKDWELIIVNDCSTDNTLEVAKSYADKDKRIRVFSNEKNSKLPVTLNHGFREARGEYWTWTSDDNLLLPTMLEEMYSYLDANSEVGMVVSDRYTINEKGDVIDEVRVPDDLNESILSNNGVGASFLYRSEVAKQAGPYSEELFLVEDYEYWIRLSFVTKLGVLHRFLYKYRIHGGSLSATRKDAIAAAKVKMRILYLPKVEEKWKQNPQMLLLYYYRIADNLHGRQRWQYIWMFTKKYPIRFGVKYHLVHYPHYLWRSLFRDMRY